MSRDDPKDRILEAAGNLFSEKGFSETTVREIAHRAGVNAAGINYYFGSKKHLYTEVLRQAAEEMAIQIPPEQLEGLPPAEKIRLLIRERATQILGGDPSSWKKRLIHHEIMRPTPIGREMIGQNARKIADRFVKVLQEILPESLPRHHLYKLTMSIFAQILYFYDLSEKLPWMLLDEEDRAHFNLDALLDHITANCFAFLGLEAPDWEKRITAENEIFELLPNKTFSNETEPDHLLEKIKPR